MAYNNLLVVAIDQEFTVLLFISVDCHDGECTVYGGGGTYFNHCACACLESSLAAVFVTSAVTLN